MSNAEIFRSYLARFTSGDRDGAAAPLTEDFRFHGPMLQSQGKAEFLEGSVSIPMAEWNTFRDGKLASARLIFDTAAMAAPQPTA
jgi:ketosteroid isomerase-like protein